MGKCGLDLTGSDMGLMAGPREDGSEHCVPQFNGNNLTFSRVLCRNLTRSYLVFLKVLYSSFPEVALPFQG
jgi:hypothetical protein